MDNFLPERQKTAVFWLQLLLVFVASTHYLTVYFFLLPVLLGFIFSLSLMMKPNVKKDSISMFFFFLFTGYLFRSGFNGLYFTLGFWQDLLLILYNYSMVRLFADYKLGGKESKWVLYILSSLIIFYLVGKNLGLNSLEISKIIFTSSSYHIVAWFGLILVALVFASQGLSRNSLIVVTLYFLLCILLGGRTGVFISLFLLLAYLFVAMKERFSFILSLIIISGVLFFMLIILEVDFNNISISKDLTERGTSLGPREFIWLCYLDRLNIETVVFGFDKELVSACVKPYISRVSVESSFFSLQLLTGFFFIFILLILIVRVIKSLQSNLLLFCVNLCFLFRMATGEFVFITAFDWLFLINLFHIDNSENIHEKIDS